MQILVIHESNIHKSLHEYTNNLGISHHVYSHPMGKDKKSITANQIK